jgi:hypothetical protein
MKRGEAPDFTEDEQGTVWFKNRLCVPETGDLRESILREAHDSAYSIHSGSTKMYQDLKQRYWWYGLKRDVAAHVALCDTCHWVKVEHQRPTGLLQPLKVPAWSEKRSVWISLWVYLEPEMVMIRFGSLWIV